MRKIVFTVIAILVILVLVSVILVHVFNNSKKKESEVSKISTNPSSVYVEYSIKNYPISDNIEIEYEDNFLSQHIACYEQQVGPRCAGYSSAYMLRTFGIDAKGSEVYGKLNYVMSDSGVMPDGVLEALNTDKTKATLYRGNLETLKTRLNEGYPLLVLIGNSSEQHYLNVVGYDDKNIYLVDTNYSTDNSNGYNRVMTNEEFLNDWNNCISPFNNIYFFVEESN